MGAQAQVGSKGGGIDDWRRAREFLLRLVSMAMQARALCCMAHRKGWTLGSALTTSRRRNSFIKQVMEQVKKDMEADEKLKKDWDNVQKSSQKFRDHSSRQEER